MISITWCCSSPAHPASAGPHLCWHCPLPCPLSLSATVPPFGALEGGETQHWNPQWGTLSGFVLLIPSLCAGRSPHSGKASPSPPSPGGRTAHQELQKGKKNLNPKIYKILKFFRFVPCCVVFPFQDPATIKTTNISAPVHHGKSVKALGAKQVRMMIIYTQWILGTCKTCFTLCSEHTRLAGTC